MNWRPTLWLTAAAVLLGLFILVVERPARRARAARPDSERVLPNLVPENVSGLEIRGTSNVLAVTLARTNGLWEIRQPERRPAQHSLVEGLLRRLAELRGASVLTTAELRSRPHAAADFGLQPPLASLAVESPSGRTEILLGTRSLNGKQVFYQVVGLPGIFAADADLFDRLPLRPEGWRETALVPLDRLQFDRLRVAAGGAAFALARNPTNGIWEMIEPRPARADASRVGVLLRQLSLLQVARFLAPTSTPPPEVAGLRPPRLLLSLARGSNEVFQLALGNGITNTPTLFAQRPGEADTLAAPAEALELLRVPYKDLLDRRLLRFERAALGEIEIAGPTSAPPVRIVRTAGRTWQVEPGPVPADIELLERLLVQLEMLESIDVAKEVVTDLDLASYGLAPPAGRIVLRRAAGDTNAVLAQLETGALRDNRVFARVPGEAPVYVLNPADLEPLPHRVWQMRDRQAWRFDAPQVAAVATRIKGLDWSLRRQGTNDWAAPPGALNDINPFALDEALHHFGEARALAWLAEGTNRHAAFGIGKGPELTIEFRGTPAPPPLRVAFGKATPGGNRYAAATLTDGTRLVFELPRAAYTDLARELGFPDDEAANAAPSP